MQQKANLTFHISRLAWRNVLRNWRHSLATMLAIVFGFTAISLFDGFLGDISFRNEDGYSKRAMLGDVIVQHDGAEDNLDRDLWKFSINAQEQNFLKQFLERHDNVDVYNRFLHISGIIHSQDRSAVFLGFGYDIEAGEKMRGNAWAWNTVAGLPIRQAGKQFAILGTGLGAALGCEPEQKTAFISQTGNYEPVDRPFHCPEKRVTLSSTTEAAQINTVDLGIAGLFDGGLREYNKRAMHIPLDAAQRLFDTDKITMLTIKLKNSSRTKQFIAELKNAAASQNMKFEIRPWKKHKIATFVRNTQQLLSVFRNLFMTVVVIIGIMSVTNTMMKSVAERFREIGMLRSFGFRSRQLILMFGFEGLYISLIACAGGFLLTVAITLLVNSLGMSYRAGILSTPVPLRIAAAPTAWLLSALILSLLSVVTAVLTARKACRTTIAESLRCN